MGCQAQSPVRTSALLRNRLEGNIPGFSQSLPWMVGQAFQIRLPLQHFLQCTSLHCWLINHIRLSTSLTIMSLSFHGIIRALFTQHLLPRKLQARSSEGRQVRGGKRCPSHQNNMGDTTHVQINTLKSDSQKFPSVLKVETKSGG